MNKQTIKSFLGKLPYTVELYWQLVQRHKPWKAHYNLDFADAVLPDAVQEVETFSAPLKTGQQKNIFMFGGFHTFLILKN